MAGEARYTTEALLEDILAAGCLVNMHICFPDNSLCSLKPSFLIFFFNILIKTEELGVKKKIKKITLL